MLRTLPLIVAATALAACSSVPGTPSPKGVARYADDPRLGEETNRACFASSIDGFSMATRDSVLLHNGRKRYLAIVAGTCLDLDQAEAIGLDSPTSCLTPGDSIIVTRALGGTLGPQRCMITKIYDWDPKAEKPVEEQTEAPAE